MYFYILTMIFFIIIIIYTVSTKTTPTDSYISNKVSSNDVQSIWNALKTTGKDASFAVFLLHPDSPDCVNLQFSIENGNVGIDWVLLAPININDKNVFLSEAEKSGCIVRNVCQNEVDYLRSENGNPIELCQSILRHYKIKPEDKMELIIESFEWSVT